jgi:hypothetical protein
MTSVNAEPLIHRMSALTVTMGVEAADRQT